MTAPRHIALVGISIILTASCASRLEPGEFDDLPQPSGMYGGSKIYDSWIYRGTSDRGNHFTYSWNRNNIVHDRDLIAPTETVQMGNRFDLTKNHSEWKAVAPILTKAGALTSFKVVPSMSERLNVPLFPGS